MADYKKSKTDVLEDRCFKLMNSLGINIEKNNDGNITNTDFHINGKFIDFQFSCDFSDWGDLRVDIISAYKLIDDSLQATYETTRKICSMLSATNLSNFGDNDLKGFFEQYMKIQKWGKVVNRKSSQYPMSLIYFIFNKTEKEVNALNDMPDIIYFVKTEMLFDYIKNNWKFLVMNNRLKLNNKSSLGDSHGSAFFCVPLNKLLGQKIGYAIHTKDIASNTIN